jgi:peptidoglycan/xylan/chitin deacetylase (PgdA/CDA1 family)
MTLLFGSTDLERLSLRRVPMVLMYHMVDVLDEDPYDLRVTPDRFAEQMSWLRGQGLRGVSMGELVDAVRSGRERGLVGLTFDDGYVGALEHAVPELQRHGFTATMFIVAGQLGGTNAWDAGPVWPLMTGDQVRQVAAAGMEVGSHTLSHTRLAGMEASQLATEVRQSRAVLEDLLGHPVEGFAYPWGSMDAVARQAVRDAGYDYGCSVECPSASLGLMALPRIVFSQRDRARQMAAKRLFFRSYTAARGTRRHIAASPAAQVVKERLSVLSRAGGR